MIRALRMPSAFRRHSTLTPADLMTFVHLPVSDLM
jgi:hypothetical protein